MFQVRTLLLLLLCSATPLLAQLNPVDSLQRLLEKQLPDPARVNVLNDLAEKLRTKDPAAARSYALNALELANRTDYNAGFADAAVNLGDIARAEGKPETDGYYSHAIDIFLEEGFPDKAAKTLNKLGIFYMVSGRYPEADKTFREALKVYQELNENESAAGVLNNLGTVAYLKGDLSESLEFFLNALELRQASGDKAGISGLLINIGNIYTQEGQLEKARINYERALVIKNDIGDMKGVATCLNNIGSVLHHQSKNDSALHFFEQSYRISDSLQNRSGMAESLTNIGQVYSDQGNYGRALEYYFRALELVNTSKNPYAKSHLYLSLGRTNSLLGNHPQAIRYLKEALAIAEKIEAREEIENSHEALSQAYEKAGNLSKSLEHYKLFVAEKERQFNDRIAEKNADLEVRFRESQTTRQLELLRKENELQDAKLTNNRVITYSALTVSALIIFLLFALLYNYNKNQQRNRLLSSQNKDILKQKEEKEVLLKEIHHRVKNNLQIVSSLLRLQSNYIDDKRVLSYFEECQNRVYAMALIHEKLYESSDLSRISIKEYLNSLIDNLIRSYEMGIPLEKEVNVGRVGFGVNALIPVGLILNETISNTLKYAFKGRGSGKIRIDIDTRDNFIELSIADNGTGFDYETWENSPNLGIELIKTFTEQLEGTITFDNSNGTHYLIRFPAGN